MLVSLVEYEESIYDGTNEVLLEDITTKMQILV